MGERKRQSTTLSALRWTASTLPVGNAMDSWMGYLHSKPPSPHYQKGLSRRDSEGSGFAGREGLPRSSENGIQTSKDGNLLKGPWAGPKPHAAASLRPPGSHLVRVAGWHLELLSGRPGRNEDPAASG